MALAIGADQNLIAALSHAVFAISIELGSGVGFWLVFGHGAPNRRREEIELATSNALVPIDRRGAVDLKIIDDKPAEIVERFFLEVMRPRLNGRVQSMAVWTAYQVWCEQRGYSAVSHAMLAGWRAGGSIGLAAPSGIWMLNLPKSTSAWRRCARPRRCPSPPRSPKARRQQH
jgi:hypothetical protein